MRGMLLPLTSKGKLKGTSESTEYGRRCYAVGCMNVIRGGSQMARGWHYTKLFLSSALLLAFSGMLIGPSLFGHRSSSSCRLCVFWGVLLKKNANAPRPSDPPPVGEKLSLDLCRCSLPMFLWYFSVQQTTCRIGNHVYYWVWMRPDRLM